MKYQIAKRFKKDLDKISNQKILTKVRNQKSTCHYLNNPNKANMGDINDSICYLFTSSNIFVF